MGGCRAKLSLVKRDFPILELLLLAKTLLRSIEGTLKTGQSLVHVIFRLRPFGPGLFLREQKGSFSTRLRLLLVHCQILSKCLKLGRGQEELLSGVHLWACLPILNSLRLVAALQFGNEGLDKLRRSGQQDHYKIASYQTWHTVHL